MSETATTRRFGSFVGFVIVIAIGFAFYFVLSAIGGSGALTTASVVDGITGSFVQQVQWMFMNFTEPQFYGGIFAGIAVILGGFVAWILAKKNSKLSGMDVCYGNSNLFPWIFASQLISVVIAIILYIHLFDSLNVSWIATFVSIVGAPPAVMFLYGPNVKALLTGSILGGIMCAPVATWLSRYLIGPIGAPGVAANVFAMAITGVIICSICRILPWMKKIPLKSHRKTPKPDEDVYSTKWFVRRCFAEFSEAQFYGNELAGLFVLVGVTVDWLISSALPAGGSGLLPAIILSQFVGAAVGVFLYAHKFEKGGWYGTYIPVVSVGPASVLFFGGGIHTAVVAGVLGAIMGPPLAEMLASRLPEGIHPTNANVTSMGISSIVVVMVMNFVGFFG